ncbi:MAG: hypothetical protein GXP25_07405 [Planctomycetes bacterium]|nr:hypothetical protein [Planctomycetota bacterium]
MKWSIGQQRKYRAQVRELGLDDEARRALLSALTGKCSTTELDSREMADVIREQARRLGHRATQDDMIHGLERALGWYGQPARLKGFIRRQTHGRKHELSALTPREKSALIEALKGVREHRRQGVKRDRRQRQLSLIPGPPASFKR